jgi:outer membrane protein assembly factor BamE
MRNFLIIVIALLLTACGSGIPKVKPFKLEIQQGNVITSEMLLKLKPGMTKSQVRYILGTPLIQDSFHGSRWDYFYQHEKNGQLRERRNVYLTFKQELLDKVAGDVVPKGAEGAVPQKSAAPKGTRLVTPEVKAEEKGFFEKLKFWKKDDVESVDSVDEVVDTVSQTAEEEMPVVAPDDSATTQEGYELKKTEVEVAAEAKKSIWSRLKFWGDEEPARNIESLSGVELKDLPSEQ